MFKTVSRRLYSRVTLSSYRDVILYSVDKGSIDPVQLGYDAVKIGRPEILADLEKIYPNIYRSVAVRSYTLGDDTTYYRVQAEIEENL
jgi:hypothetical protein